MNKILFAVAPIAFVCIASAQTPPTSPGSSSTNAPTAAKTDGQDRQSQSGTDRQNRQGGRGFGMGGGGMGGGIGRSLCSVTEMREQFQAFIVKRDVPLIKE